MIICRVMIVCCVSTVAAERAKCCALAIDLARRPYFLDISIY